jgi:hypothetical protein
MAVIFGGPRTVTVCSLFTHIHSHIMAPTKSNGKHGSASAVKPKKKLTAASIVGAPAQHNQSSRKGKKAWRKNVDIEDLEDKLEGLREEERTFGCVFYLSTFLFFPSKLECHLQAAPTEEGRQRAVYCRYQRR